MRFSTTTNTIGTLAATFMVLASRVKGNEDSYQTPSITSTPPAYPTSYDTPPASCVTISSAIIDDKETCPKAPSGCVRPACLREETVTQSCNCPTIYTTTSCATDCPTGCAADYVTVTQPCSTEHPPPPPPSSTTSIIYTNSTKTKTSTTVITLTTCPPSVTCTGQTTTYTSTEVCPTSTCTCVLPGTTSHPAPETSLTTITPTDGSEPITSVTTIEPSSEGTAPPAGSQTTVNEGNTPPAPTSTPPLEANLAGKWGVESGAATFVGLLIAAMGVL